MKLISKTCRSLIAQIAIVILASFLVFSCGNERNKIGSSKRVAENLNSFDEEALKESIRVVLKETLTPGAVVLIRKGDQEWIEAFGSRDVEFKEAVTVEDHFRIGSNTKTWTGTAMLQLVDEGRISLDDVISKYLDSIPNGQNISIAQILNMRSGLFNYSELEMFNAILDDQPDKAWNQKELLEIAFENEPYFDPEKGYHYSNTNTIIAGLIIEKIIGKNLSEVFKERIFSRAGMNHSVMPDVTDARIPEPYAHGYLYGSNVSTLKGFALSDIDQEAARSNKLMPNDVTHMNPSWAWAAGAGISTVVDLANYVKMLVGGGLLSDQLQAIRLESLQPANASKPGGVSYGLALAKFGPLIGHDGSLPGFQSFMGYDPQRDITVVVLTNLQGGINGEGPANAIVKKITPILYDSN